MTNVKLLLAAVLAGTGFLASSSLHAQMSTTGFYAGFGLGQATVNDFCDTGNTPGVTVTSCDDNDMGWRVFGGYQADTNLAFEVGYSDGAKFNASATVLAVPVTVDAKANIIDAVALVILPLNEQFSVYGKLGIARWDIDVNVPGIGGLSEKGADLTYGIGGQFNFQKNLGVRVEWQRYSDVGEAATTGQTDVDVFGVGLVYRF